MSWLSTSITENLTNITGQISTFTKDMLTEGTVEVDDHETELKIANSRVRELELTLYTQREEYDRIKELNHELQERAEAAELQITSISREYRTLLQEKENEVIHLREQLETWKEHGSSKQDERVPSFNEDSFIESTNHDEVQYLKALVSKLQEEKKLWSKSNEKENLHKELDHYQHELATLHTTYSQRIATLNRKHKQEMEELESCHSEDSLRIQDLEQQLSELRTITDKMPNITLENLPESESDFEIIKKESIENELQAVPDELATTSEMESVSELKIFIDSLECENQDLKERLNDFELQTTKKDSELARVQQENKELIEQRDQAVISEAQTSASLESLREELSRLGMVTMELMKEVEQSQGMDKEKSIEIESLKKLCRVRRSVSEEGDPDEAMRLKDMLAVLWQKYASVVLENEKVRLEVLNIKRRLLNQLQDRHGDTKTLLDGVSETRAKLTSQLEGHQEQVSLEKQKLISMIPEVETEVENHEESVSRLVQESDENKTSTTEIVNDFGRRWSASNHVASLQAEKAVLERTIVGLEEKVQELEQRSRNQNEDETPRSSVSTFVSVESLRAPPQIPESADDAVLTEETGASHVASERGGSDGLEGNETEECNRDENKGYDKNSVKGQDKNYDKLMEKLREYEETIDEFELIKEDWEGEKEALENVLVQLRKKLKDVEKNQTVHNDVGEKRKEIEKRYLNDIKELLVEKNYISELELNESSNQSMGEEIVLSSVLEWLRRETVEESTILTQENDQYYSAIPGNEQDSFVDEAEVHNQSEVKCSPPVKMDDDRLNEGETSRQSETVDELSATKNELEAARNECGKTKRELDETSTKLKEVRDELNTTRTEREKSHADLEDARIELGKASERTADLDSKLKLLKSELEDCQVHFNNTISEKDGEVHKLRNVVEQLQGTLSNFENDKSNTISQLQEEIGNLQKELGNVTSSCDTMTTQLIQSKQELALVLEAKNSLGVQLSEVVKEKEQLLGMVNERDGRIEELQDLCDTFEQKTSLLQDEGKEKSKAFSELSEENSLLKEEKSDLFDLLETKENQLNSSARESEKLSELLREQELASEEMKRQNLELAKDLENWRIQLEELNQTKEALNRDLDTKSEEILSLKESNIELANQSYENSAEISEKLSMLEQLVSQNLALKSENETLMEALSQKKTSEKELKDSYNLLVQEKEQLDAMFSKKSSEIDHEVRRKTDEIEVLRLEVARLTKECQEKDHMIRTQVSANLASGNDDHVTVKQEHIRRILQEKDVEIDALRTKNDSLLKLFADNEQEKEKVRQEHEKQITTMLERQERMLNELNDKSDQMIALEDRLEMLNIKSASKDQASALIHAEHQKLLHLNESQSEEIGRLREKVTTLGVLVAERDHSASGEVQKLRQRNSDLQLQVDALQGEQERLLMVVHDKDQQLSSSVRESPVRRSEELFVSAPPPDNNGFQNISQNEDELRRIVEENQKLSQEIISLQNNASFLNDSIEEERKRKRTLAEENDVINQRLRSLEATQVESGNSLRRLQIESEKLKEALSAKERQILAEKEENNLRIYEINTLKNEKDEIFLEQNSQVEELQTKLSSLLDVISSDDGFKDEQFEILENREDFERLVTRIKNHRARLRSDKENEVRLLKEQVETLSSVQNISNPELEAKLEQFIHEKDEMNKKLSEMETEKLELLEEKENELTSLQMQVVDISNILKQEERKWLAEKQAFSEKNSLLEKRTKILEQERDSWNETKSQSETEISRLRDEITSLTTSTDMKLDVVLNEKDRKVKDLERELDGFKQRYSRSLQEAQDMKSELDTARQQMQEFEIKKEKELERLRTHLLQVEDSYTQEALASEERENELRHQLEQIQQQLLTSSHSLQDSTRTASMKMENLEEQLISVTAHRDEVQAQLEQSQEQTLQYMRSVENLQMVLEQFQREKGSELKNLRESNREQLADAQREVARLREREIELQQLLQNASDALNKADKLSDDLRSKEDEIENLKTTVTNLEADLQSSHDKLRKLTSNNDNKIEKGLMKNMLLAYFNTSEHKRSEVVAVLGHILNFTEDEIKKVGTGSKPPQASGWFSGLLSYSGSNPPQQQHDKSFSELFVSFLEKESESELVAQSLPRTDRTRPLPSGTRSTTTVTAIPARLRDSPLPMSPLASSTPYGNAKPVANPLLMNAREEEAGGSSGTRGESGNALLGSSLRPSLDLPTITKSSSSSTALREILFNS